MTNPASNATPATAPVMLEKELDNAEKRAWTSLARYQFQMFGYWVAIWVHLNRIGGFYRPNPWAVLVGIANGKLETKDR